jgi:hypothetical protein
VFSIYPHCFLDYDFVFKTVVVCSFFLVHNHLCSEIEKQKTKKKIENEK